MSSCINKNSLEYKALQERANIPEPLLYAICRGYVNEFGRFPELDEIPNADSYKHIVKKLKLDKDNYGNTETILKELGVSTIDEANIRMNQVYKDKETIISQLGETSLVNIRKKPTIFDLNEVTNEVDINANSGVFMSSAFSKLARLHGIKINEVDNNTTEFQEKPAYIKNGEIYINSDIASLDAPIHEMLHLVLGSIRFNNPNLYFELVQSVSELENFKYFHSLNSGRVMSDIMEEFFVLELSKYLAGYKSKLNVPQYDIFKSIYRVLDIILEGQNSSEIIKNNEIKDMSILDVAKIIGSATLSKKFKGSLPDAQLHRILGNLKQDMMKNGELKEICE